MRIGSRVWLSALLWSWLVGMGQTSAASCSWHLTPVASYHKLTARAPGVLEPFPATPAQLRAARDEWECFQIVITASDIPLNDVSASATGLATPLGEYIPQTATQLFWENYVFVAHPSGNRRLEKLWWPDALIPVTLQPHQSILPHQSKVLWAAIQIPPDAKPGEYYGAVDVTADGQTRQFAVLLTVEPVTLPAPTLRGNVAVYYDVLRDWYAKNLKPLDDGQFARMKRQYYDFLLDYRLNAYDLPVAWSDDAADNYLNDPRVLSVRLPGLGTPAMPTALARLRRTNTLGKSYYYQIDEPPPERYDEVRDTTRKLRALDSNLKQCVTVHPNRTLADAVDIWCPNIGDFFGLGHLDLDALAAERKEGRETWWYTMVEPKYPYPTWLLDDDVGAIRLYGWTMARWDINGFVYSMAHGWGPKPLENLQSFAGTNGDGTLLYPSEPVGGSGPMPSIRLMLLRDTIEDYELLHLLPASQRDRLTQKITNDASPTLHPDYATIDWPQLRATLFRAIEGHPIPPQTAPTEDWQKVPYAKLLVNALHSNGAVPRLTVAPTIDGQLNDVAWNEQARCSAPFQRIAGDTLASPPTSLWLAHDAHYLYIALRAQLQAPTAQGEWVAIDIAPLDATERWRFIITADGKTAVERHTREGRFGIEGLSWQAALKIYSGSYNVEIKLPLSVLKGAHSFRFNALRRVNDIKLGTRYTVRVDAMDAGDVTLMPVMTLAP